MNKLCIQEGITKQTLMTQNSVQNHMSIEIKNQPR